MKTTSVIAGLIVGVLFLPMALQAQNKFIGVKLCTACHKTDKQGKQLAIWQSSAHSKAYKTLESDKSKEIAKKKGLATPATEAPECLSCHAPNHAKTSLFEKTFDIKDGVQCEDCHGAGSQYKTLTVMKEKAKAIAAGMKEFKDEAAIKALCETCHNKKSPTYKEFKFAEEWAKIKHPVPKK